MLAKEGTVSERYLYLNGRLVSYSEAERHGLIVAEREVDRTELCLGDEAFFCGSGWEVTAIASIDRLPLGRPAPGPV